MTFSYTSEAAIRTKLGTLLNDLGRNGGQISPSVYDTAQVLRLGPPTSTPDNTATWLCEQQAADGGWGSSTAPLARDVSTLAALLALNHVDKVSYRSSIERGLAFLRSNSTQWHGPLGDNIPGSVEIILPSLLEAAQEQGIEIDNTPYQGILALHHKRLTRIARLSNIAGTTATHAWEGWGTTPTRGELDLSGGVGHSPAATAAWLGRHQAQASIDDTRNHAEVYLQNAATATGVPGVFPTAWPIPRFEQCFGLYALLLAGHLNDPQLAPFVQPQLASLQKVMTAHGLGMSDAFQPDGDDTAVALAVLAAAGTPMDAAILDRFLFDDHYVTWPNELQPSLSVNVHAIHARALLSKPLDLTISYVLDRQTPDGRWLGDKWHASWIYGTSHTLIALHTHAPAIALERAIDALVRAQLPDGGWGSATSTAEETAYALLALYHYASHNTASLGPITRRGHQWLQHHANTNLRPRLWLGKEPYTAPRIVDMFVFAALLRGMNQ